MSSFQNPNFKKLVGLLTPTPLRKPKRLSWLKVLVSPVIVLHDAFKQKREKDLYNLAHNSQVCYLRKVLNDAFDATLRRIEIVDGDRYGKTYIYTEGEEKPKFLNTLYLRDKSVFEDTGVDFIVLVPFEIWNIQKTEVDIGEYKFYNIEAIVDFYKLASKRYKIEYKNE